MSPRAGEHRGPQRSEHGQMPGPGEMSLDVIPRAQGPDVHVAWESNRRWVAAILLAHKPRWADLEDLLQDVATSLVAHAKELRDPAAVKPWLRTVAINAARLAARKGKLRLHDSLNAAAAGEESPRQESFISTAEPQSVTPPKAGDEATRVAELAITLPESYREALLLKAVHGLSYRQISQILELPETTIETRIARGRRMLRELVAQSGVPTSELT